MDSLRLGLVIVKPPDGPEARRQRQDHERRQAEMRQWLVLSWIAEKKLNFTDIATAIGVHPSSVRGVLTGFAQLPPSWIKPLATLLGVTPDALRQAWRPWLKRRTYMAVLTRSEEHVRQMVQELLLERRVRQRVLARAINVKQSEVSQAINGRRHIPLFWHEPLARFFNIPLEDFKYTGPEETKVQPPPPKRRRRTKVTLTPEDQHARSVIAQLLTSTKTRQRDLAVAVGVQQSSISCAVNGLQHIPVRWYARLAAYFNVPQEVFILS